MKRISPERMIEIRDNAYQDEDRLKYAGNCIVTAAQAQLESCEEEVDKQFNPDWLKTKEHYEEIIRDMVKEHSEVGREIIDKIKRAVPRDGEPFINVSMSVIAELEQKWGVNKS